MAAYTDQATIETQISPQDLIAALDDSNQGTLDVAILNRIIAAASNEVDGYLSGLYTVPFNPIPSQVSTAALYFACEAIYRRRLAAKELNIFTYEAKYWREFLKGIAEGELSLDQSVSRAFAPGVAITACMQTNGTSA